MAELWFIIEGCRVVTCYGWLQSHGLPNMASVCHATDGAESQLVMDDCKIMACYRRLQSYGLCEYRWLQSLGWLWMAAEPWLVMNGCWNIRLLRMVAKSHGQLMIAGNAAASKSCFARKSKLCSTAGLLAKKRVVSILDAICWLSINVSHPVELTNVILLPLN